MGTSMTTPASNTTAIKPIASQPRQPTKCLRCGRGLKAPKSRAAGYGPLCAKKPEGAA